MGHRDIKRGGGSLVDNKSTAWLHQQQTNILTKSGLNVKGFKVVKVDPPSYCSYYDCKDAMVPKLEKYKLQAAKFTAVKTLSPAMEGQSANLVSIEKFLLPLNNKQQIICITNNLYNKQFV